MKSKTRSVTRSKRKKHERALVRMAEFTFADIMALMRWYRSIGIDPDFMLDAIVKQYRERYTKRLKKRRSRK